VNVDAATERYFQLLQALDQAVIATDPAGAIILWSPAAESLYGWRADEVVGRSVLEVTPMEMSRAQGAEIMEALARGELWSGEFQVRTHDGRPFMASVTDIPLLDDSGVVAGVIGVSAPSRTPTSLRPLLSQFAAAVETIWPNQVTFKLHVPEEATVQASEPHMIQLLAVLILLHARTLDRGGLEVSAMAADTSPFADFGMAYTSPALYVRIDRRSARVAYSVLRSVPFSEEPTKRASALVRMVGGILMAGSAPDGMDAMHLFLPLIR